MAPIHSLRTKILIIVLVFFASIGMAFVIYSLITTINYKRLRLEGIEKTVEFETERVNKAIAELEHGAINMAINGLLFYESQSYSIGTISVLESLRSFPVPAGGGFWFEPYAYNRNTLRACVYAYVNKERNEVLLDDFDVAEYDYHSMDWYYDIKNSVTASYQAVWTKPYIDDTSFNMMTTAGAGIFDKNGSLIGIAILDWEIDEVVKELVAIKPTENSFVLLCVPEKDYIISSTRTNSSVGASVGSLPWDINADHFNLNGTNYLRFGRYMDNGWLLSIQIPENEIFAEVENQNSRFSAIIAFSSIAMLFIAYFLISKLINTPIKQLTSDVSQLALGNLDMRIEISSKDELGLLAQTFNKMTSDLKKSIEENVREREEKERINTELSVAKGIQAGMLPCVFPPFPGRTEFDLYAAMLPAREVGGDFYDFYFVDKDNLAIVIADVSGKGVPAALFMVIARTLIKNCSVCKRPKAVFETVNIKLCEDNETGMFVTAFMGFYNVSTKKFIFVNAGHNPPLIKRRGSSYEYLKTEPCVILGFMKDTKYREEEITLESGDILCLYTDGVTEAMNNNKELFSEERLLEAANQYRNCPPRDLLYAIKREVDNFSDGAEQADDITMLALKANDTVEVTANMPDDSIKELKVGAVAENLSKVIEFVNKELNKCNYPSTLQTEIDTAVEEIFINIVNYAYKPGSGNVAVFISTKNKTVIRFEDTGKPYNPLEHIDPDFDIDINEREIGGLGIYLVKKFMDNVEYSHVENKNILTLTKEHPQGE